MNYNRSHEIFPDLRKPRVIHVQKKTHDTRIPRTNLGIAGRGGAADGDRIRTLEPRNAPGAAAAGSGTDVLWGGTRAVAAAVPFVERERSRIQRLRPTVQEDDGKRREMITPT